MFPGQRPVVTLREDGERVSRTQLLLDGFEDFRKQTMNTCREKNILLRVCAKDHDTVMREEDELPDHVWLDDKPIKSGTHKVVLDAFIRAVEGIPLEPWTERPPYTA
jgi:hypothetical protein